MATSTQPKIGMDFFSVNPWRLRMVFACLLFPLFPSVGLALDFQVCNGCHEGSLEKEYGRINQHSPFALQHCDECHAAKTPDSLRAKTAGKNSSAPSQDRRKITWQQDSVMAATEHCFVLPRDKVGSALIVEAQSLTGEFSRQEIAVPSLAGLPEIPDSGQPPLLSGVKVLNVRRGVFLSATIGWQTDTLTDAKVSYGPQGEGLTQTSRPSSRFGRRHEVVLYELEPDRTYRFQAVSRDLFGRSQTSEPAEFSTSQPVTTPLPAPSSSSWDEAAMTSHFSRLGKDYLLQLDLGRPAAVYVGWRGPVREQAVPAAQGGTIEAHAGLSSEAVISMEACRNCHQNQSAITHPVNIYPNPGMTIPPEYPTLPDGRITCNSCHESHSSDYEYLTRKPGKRELCVGCHQDML